MSVRSAYTATGAAWQAGPARIYDRLAEALVARCPLGVAGRLVLDLGAGTGAASRAAVAAGAAAVVASDSAIGMLAVAASTRPPACAGDALALPFTDGSFGSVVAAFSLNHLVDPAAGLLEAARVLRPSGGLAASAYAEDDTHPAKDAVDAALHDRGWASPPWYQAMKADAVPRLATVERAVGAMAEAGLSGAEATNDRIAFPDLSPTQLVAWRLGMAQAATFVAALSPAARAELAADAVARLADAPPLVRSVITLTWQRP